MGRRWPARSASGARWSADRGGDGGGNESVVMKQSCDAAKRHRLPSFERTEPFMSETASPADQPKPSRPASRRRSAEAVSNGEAAVEISALPVDDSAEPEPDQPLMEAIGILPAPCRPFRFRRCRSCRRSLREPRSVLAAVQSPGAGGIAEPQPPASRARAVPVDLGRQSRRVLHGARGRARRQVRASLSVRSDDGLLPQEQLDRVLSEVGQLRRSSRRLSPSW